MAQKILVASGKGGVGKSTLCLGVAAGLAARGRAVLVLEADAGFRGLDLSLAASATALYDLRDLMEGRSSLSDTILCHSKLGVHLVCAPADPECQPQPQRLAALMADLDSRYHTILVDCGAGFGSWHAAFASLCDQAVVVTQPDPVSVRGTAQLSLLLHRRGLANQRLVINRVPPRLPKNGPIEDLDDVIDRCGVQLLGAIPEGRMEGLPLRNAGQPQEELYRIAERLDGQPAPLVIW